MRILRCQKPTELSEVFYNQVVLLASFGVGAISSHRVAFLAFLSSHSVLADFAMASLPQHPISLTFIRDEAFPISFNFALIPSQTLFEPTGDPTNSTTDILM